MTNITQNSFKRGNFKQFIKILKSEEYKSHPELFASQVLAHSTPERIKDILSMDEWKQEKYKHLLKSGILLTSKEKLTNNINPTMNINERKRRLWI